MTSRTRTHTRVCSLQALFSLYYVQKLEKRSKKLFSKLLPHALCVSRFPGRDLINLHDGPGTFLWEATCLLG